MSADTRTQLQWYKRPLHEVTVDADGRVIGDVAHGGYDGCNWALAYAHGEIIGDFVDVEAAKRAVEKVLMGNSNG